MSTVPPTPDKNTFETIARFTRKVFQFFFKTIAAATIAVLILIIIVPLALFVWRSTRPLNDPMFNGLSLYEVTLLRYDQYQEFTTQYNATHPYPQYPGQKKLATPELCFWTEIGYEVTVFPAMIIGTQVNFHADNPPMTKNLAGFITATWTNFEFALISKYERTPHQQAAACRLPPTFPTLETSHLGE